MSLGLKVDLIHQALTFANTITSFVTSRILNYPLFVLCAHYANYTVFTQHCEKKIISRGIIRVRDCE